MLTESTKALIRSKYDQVKLSTPGFCSRPGQRLMIAEVARTLGRYGDACRPGQTICCINGGTGVGKSLGYSLPAVLMALEHRKKVVISSSTVALQEQLVQDLPRYFASAGIDVGVNVAKGRTRYVCLHRFESLVSEGTSAPPQVQRMATAFACGGWSGDRDAWCESVPDEVWAKITTDRHGCTGKMCPEFQRCLQAKARKEIQQAEVIIANHDLVLTDLMLDGKLISKPEDTFYVFDEAHNLPAKAIERFATSYDFESARKACRRLIEYCQTVKAFRSPAEIQHSARELGLRLTEAHAFLSSLLQLRPTATKPRPVLHFNLDQIPEEFVPLGNEIVKDCDILSSAIAAEIAWMSSCGLPREERQVMLSALGRYSSKVRQLRDTWNLFLSTPESPEQAPVAKWIQAQPGKAQIDFQFCASPIIAADVLTSHLWSRAAGVVLASASLTAMGSFDDFLMKTGLKHFAPSVSCIELPSPFDYRRQSTLNLVECSSPKDYQAHTLQTAAFVASAIQAQKAEGSLVLFTSRQQLDDVLELLPKHVRETVLVQGQAPKSALLAAHTARIDAGLASSIFGLATFSEGISLAGSYLTHVMIPKLPFAVPDTPVARTLVRWIESSGSNAFMKITVADAFRKLEQSVGRLIRTESDHGQVSILDPRLWTTGFGRAMLEGLPPMNRQFACLELRS